MTELCGYKEQNIYASEGFYVYSFKTGNKSVRLVSRKEILTRLKLKVYGEWDKSQKQFILSDYSFSVETDEELLDFLSEEADCCNPVLAKKIYEEFGSKMREKLCDPESLKGFFFLRGEEKARKLCKSFKEKTYCNTMLIEIVSKYKLPHGVATKIFNLATEEEIRHIVNSNIYLFCEEPFSVSFRTIERIALKHGLKGTNSEERLKWYAVSILEEAELAGNLYLDLEEFTQKLTISVNSGSERPLYSDKKISETLSKFFKDGKTIKLVVGRVYLTKTEYSEKIFAAEIVKRRLKASYDINNALIENEINNYQSFENIVFADAQKEAIRIACKNQIMILTGGPGTGKTTVVKGVIAVLSKLFGYNDEDITLVAPTGKAATRMTESTGLTASTIHSAICLGEKDTEGKELKGKLVVIDESSMLDQRVAYALIKAIPENAKIIFVGDVDQLQSVGAGDVLNSLINSGIVPVVKLSVVHRQENTSSIVLNANALNNGETKLVFDDNFSFIEVKNNTETIEKIVEKYKEYSEKYGEGNVILVCPRRKDTEISVQTLNPILQKVINKNTDGVTIGDNMFIIGDRVIQTKNTADIANGEIGNITAVYKELTEDHEVYRYRFKINFSGYIVEYSEADMRNVELAYAITVHKSQGSEYAHVIVPILSSQHNMLKRNLVYTAITRAKQSVCLIGQKNALYNAIKNSEVVRRNTLLADRLVSYAKKIKNQ